MRYRTLLMTAALALGAVSCDLSIQGLEQYPLDKESEGSYFQDAAQLQAYSNSFYKDLFTGPFHDGTDDLLLASSLSTWIRGGNLRTVPSSGGGWSWGTLADINALLDHLDRCSDAAVREEYEGLARFFRAYFYYLKVRSFGDVPWYDHELNAAESSELYKGRDSRDYVMERMLEDIDFAIGHLPSGKQLYRVTRWTAMAFKSRFCLFEGTWRKYHGNIDPVTGETYGHGADYYLGLCAAVAEDFIRTSPYTIYETGHPESDYGHVFNQATADADEVILAKSYSLAQSVSHTATYNTFGSTTASSFSKKFVDAFLMADGTRFTDRAGWQTMEYYDETTGRDPRLGQIIRTPGYRREGLDSLLCADFNHTFTGFQPVKYALSYTEYPSFNWGPTDNDLPIFRAAEVYLNYAEAQAERSDRDITDEDLALSVTPLRHRAGMPAMAAVSVMDAAPDDTYMGSARWGYRNVAGKHRGTILEIRRERLVELAMEGDFRHYDLLRWKEGKCVEQEMYGMYFPRLGAYDFDHVVGKDGTLRDEMYIYQDAADKDKGPAGVPAWKVGEGYFILSGGTSGYVDPHAGISRTFDEGRDYLNPLPTTELSVNRALLQNPGWQDIERN
ncbi:MAG: RagB/SusD family nutrient uptake outer membrane protein [Bacteroidales bacterium]|nr:RagB/SusD family nutrient uptake outer membrane protein [Bacteroidales bacterium]